MDEKAVPRLSLLLALLLSYSLPSDAASSFAESASEMAWNLIGAISRIRHGDGADVVGEEDGQSGSSLLSDPHFLYATFYREDDGWAADSSGDGGDERSAPTMAASFHGNNLLRVLDILEIEHRLRRLRQTDQRDVIDETIDESAIATASASGRGGGAVAEGGCNMADISSEEETSTAESSDAATAACSIKRSPRQVEDLEPYVPYLGFIFYSFPIFSFTLPFGGQLKLFGYDFI